MPKLPDIEYAVVSQGPPNVAQAMGNVAEAMFGIQKVAHEASMAFAEEQAKTQISEASLLVEQGLADTEQKLKKPYLSPAEVKSAFPNGAPPEVQTVLDRYQDENAAAVPTHEVGAAIHAEVGKRLTEEAVPLVYSSKVRADFERKLASETLHRNIKVSQEMLSQGAELNAAKSFIIWERTLNSLPAATDDASRAAWSDLRSSIEASGLISPAKKLEILAKVDEARAARPVYDAIASERPEAIQSALVAIETPEAAESMSVAHRAQYKKMLTTALDGIERGREQERLKAEKAVADAAVNRQLSLIQRSLGGENITPAQRYAALPRVGTVPPQTMEHLLGMVADSMKPKEAQTKTNLGAWALVENSRVAYPEEWAQGVIVIPDGKGGTQKTSVLALHAQGALSLDDSKSLLQKQADAWAKPETANQFALQKTDHDEINRLLEFTYKFNTSKTGDKWQVPENEKVVGWMYKVVESDLAAAARKKPGGRLEVDERTAIIRKTLAREVKNQGTWYGGTKQIVENVGEVPPDFESAYHTLPVMPGKNAAHQEIAKTYKAFVEKYQLGADEAWKEFTKGQPFTARDAAVVSIILQSRKQEIDDELKRAGKFNVAQDAANDPMRAALAVRFYLSGARRRR